MNRNHKAAILLVLLVSMASLAVADDNNHSASWIRMGIGARSMAMGGTGTAMTNDVTAAYWNPAGLARMKNIEFGSMYTDGLDWDRTLNALQLGVRFRLGAAAVNWVNANTTGLQEWDGNGAYQGDFDADEHNIGLSFSTAPRKFKWGFTAKMYMSNMGDESKSGFGLDTGFIYDVNQYMSFGAMARDFYAKIDETEVPAQYNVGVSLYPFDGVTLAADWRQEKHSDKTEIHLGGEYWTGLGDDVEVGSQLSGISLEERTQWQKIMADTQGGLRLGFNDGDFTCGMGLRFRMIEVDYAYVMGGDEGFNDSHRLSLLLRF